MLRQELTKDVVAVNSLCSAFEKADASSSFVVVSGQ